MDIKINHHISVLTILKAQRPDFSQSFISYWQTVIKKRVYNEP